MVGLKPSEIPPTTAVKFLGAGMAACFADLLTFPLDTAKVRLQVGALGLGSLFTSKEGLRSLPQHLYRLPTSSSSHTTLSRPLTPLLPTLPCCLPKTKKS